MFFTLWQHSILVTKLCRFSSQQAILRQQLGALHFNLILILSTWRWCQIPQDCPTSDASQKFKLLPVLLSNQL